MCWLGESWVVCEFVLSSEWCVGAWWVVGGGFSWLGACECVGQVSRGWGVCWVAG